jgi:MFS family permease
VALLTNFFILGVVLSTWGARLPAIKAALHLSNGRLGLALFAAPAGSVLTLALSGRITDRFGPLLVVRVAGLLVASSLVIIGLARNLAEFMAALAYAGAVGGLLDVSMNAAGSRLEAAYGRPILSSFHAGFSIAGLAGAGLGGLFAALSLGPLPNFVTAAAGLAVLSVAAGRRIVLPPAAAPQTEPSGSAAHSDRQARARQISVLIWVMGLLALCGQLGEGSANDWSAVYLHTTLGSPAGVAVLALAAFSITMAAGRVAGDRLAARFGPVRLVRVSGLIAGLGLAAGLLVRNPAAAIAGFALLGAGQAGIFPQIVSAAARLDPAHAGRNIGRVCMVSYTGLLCGPVVIGAVAGGAGLRAALLIPAALSLVVAAFATVVSPASAPARTSAPAPAEADA